MGIQQLLDRLVTMGGERAATPQDAEEQRKLDRVARLARELSEALSAVEVTRGPRGSQPA